MKIWRSKEQPIAGFFERGTNLTGELKFSGVMRIDGNFHGSIDGGDVLIVGANAVIQADIRVREIEIHGQVLGNIEAGGRAVIHSTGRFRGDLQSPVLVVHDGGVLDGFSHMSAASETGGKLRESTQVAAPGLNQHRRSLDAGGQY